MACMETDYKYHSKDTHFRWTFKWWLEFWGALGIMGGTAPLSAKWKCSPMCKDAILGNLRKAVEDSDGNVGKTIKLITQDKKHTWICEIRLTFVPSWYRVRRQCSISTFSAKRGLYIFSFTTTHWRQLKFSEIEANSEIKANAQKKTHPQGLCQNLLLADARSVLDYIS